MLKIGFSTSLLIYKQNNTLLHVFGHIPIFRSDLPVIAIIFFRKWGCLTHMAHMIPNSSTPVIPCPALRDNVIFQEYVKNYYEMIYWKIYKRRYLYIVLLTVCQYFLLTSKSLKNVIKLTWEGKWHNL